MNQAKSYHHGNLRQELINAGLMHLEEKGLTKLSLRALAESLGVSKTAPYRHFKTKRDLLVALAAEGYQLFADMLEKQELVLSELKTDKLLPAVYKVYGDFAHNQPELYRLMFSRLGNSLHSERCRLNSRRAFSVLIRIGERLTKPGTDVRALVLSLFAALHGWTTILLDDMIPPETGVNIENWLDFVVGPEIQGLF